MRWPGPLVLAPRWAAFETTYIGLAVTHGLDTTGRRRATTISLGAVVASIIYNTLAGWFHAQPDVLAGAGRIGWLCLAVLHGAPLAWVAFLVASLLLHQQGDRTHLPRQRRALIRRLVSALRSARAQLAQSQATAAQLASDLAQLQAATVQPDPLLAQQTQEIPQLRAAAAQQEQYAAEQAREQTDRLRRQEQEIAQLQEQLAQLLSNGDIDRLAVARRLRSSGASSRETADLLRMPESTLRARLKETNGHHAEVSS